MMQPAPPAAEAPSARSMDGVRCWNCCGRVDDLAPGQPLIRCPECGLGNLRPVVGVRRCARCRYDLTSLARGASFVTCPECGSKGSPELVCDPVLPPLPKLHRIAVYLSGPTVVLCLVCVGLTALELDAVLQPAAALALASGSVVPFAVGGVLSRRHAPRRRRGLTAVALIGAGVAANLIIVASFLAIGVAIRVGDW